MSPPRAGIAKLIVAIALAAIVGAAFLFMTQEQKARAVAQTIYDSLSETVDGDSLTIEQVHERLGREPNATRTPFKHRVVEEYTVKGPFESHTVYAYYSSAAATFLEATSIDKKLPDWESE